MTHTALFTLIVLSTETVAMKGLSNSFLIREDISVIVASKLVSCDEYVLRLASNLFCMVYLFCSKLKSRDVMTLNADISYLWQPEYRKVGRLE